MKRSGSANWHFRQRRPSAMMRPGLRTHEIVSLGTADYRQALSKLPEAREIIAARFRDAAVPQQNGIVPSVKRRQRPDGLHLPLLSTDDVAALARNFFERELLHLDMSPVFPQTLPKDVAERIEQELEHRVAELTFVDDDEEVEHPALATEIGLLAEAGFRSPYDSRASVLFREYLRRALLQIAKIEHARFSGNFAFRPDDELFRAISLPASAATMPRTGAAQIDVTVGEAVDMFLAELLQRTRAEKTQDRYRREVAHIAAFLDPQTPISMVKRKECVDFRDTFAALPPNFGKALHEGATIRTLVAKRLPTDAVLQWETHEKYLAMFRRFIAWSAKQDYIEKDYADDLKPLAAKPDGSMAKLPFEITELGRILTRPIYTGCRDDAIGFNRSGPNIIRRSRYWAPLISLFGGLRAGEILQLTPDHFRQSDAGTPFIVLTSDMKLKNGNAQREVPVHPALQRMGLLGWVERRRLHNAELLFPEVPRDKYDAGSPIFSKRFRSDLKHFELGDRRPKLTFHSFRHTFKAALDDADVTEQHKDELCGWSRSKKIGRRYGTGLSADVLRPYVERLTYAVEVDHLFAHAKLQD